MTTQKVHISNKGFCHLFESVLLDMTNKDLVIVCGDGRLYAHRIILAAASPFLESLLADIKVGDSMILMPDFRVATLQNWLCLAYSGQGMIHECDLAHWNELNEALGFHKKLACSKFGEPDGGEKENVVGSPEELPLAVLDGSSDDIEVIDDPLASEGPTTLDSHEVPEDSITLEDSMAVDNHLVTNDPLATDERFITNDSLTVDVAANELVTTNDCMTTYENDPLTTDMAADENYPLTTDDMTADELLTENDMATDELLTENDPLTTDHMATDELLTENDPLTTDHMATDEVLTTNDSLATGEFLTVNDLLTTNDPLTADDPQSAEDPLAPQDTSQAFRKTWQIAAKNKSSHEPALNQEEMQNRRESPKGFVAETVWISNDGIHKSPEEQETQVFSSNHDAKTPNKKKIMREKFKCGICGMRFRTIRSLSQHRTKMHAAHKCHLCQRILFYKESFVKHMQTHGIKDSSDGVLSQSQIKFTCKECKKEFQDSNMLAHHMKTSHKPPKATIQLRPRSTDKQHALEAPPATPSPVNVQGGHNTNALKCLSCFLVFKSNQELHTHRKIHGPRPTFDCPICLNTIIKEEAYLLHLTRHSEHQAATECLICGEVFTSRTLLLRHIHSHYGDSQEEDPPKAVRMRAEVEEPERQKCSSCDLTFHSKEALVAHKSNHQLPFKCNICKEAFVSVKLLMTHISHHGLQKEATQPSPASSPQTNYSSRETAPQPVHLCTLCHISFHNKNSLARHYKQLHNFSLDTTAADTSQVYQCNHCIASFRMLQDLQRHQQMMHLV